VESKRASQPIVGAFAGARSNKIAQLKHRLAGLVYVKPAGNRRRERPIGCEGD